MLVVEQYLNIRLLLKQCPFCLEYLSEKKNKKGENAQKVKKNPSSITYHHPGKDNAGIQIKAHEQTEVSTGDNISFKAGNHSFMQVKL